MQDFLSKHPSLFLQDNIHGVSVCIDSIAQQVKDLLQRRDAPTLQRLIANHKLLMIYPLDEQKTVLHLACSQPHQEMLDVVIKALGKHIVPIFQNYDIMPFFTLAASKIGPEGAILIGESSFWTMSDYEMCAINAVKMGSIAIVHACLTHGIPVDYTTNDGATLLHLAAQHNQAEVARFLVMNGADVHRPDSTHMKAEQVAYTRGYHETAKIIADTYLIKLTAKTNREDTKSKDSDEIPRKNQQLEDQINEQNEMIRHLQAQMAELLPHQHSVPTTGTLTPVNFDRQRRSTNKSPSHTKSPQQGMQPQATLSLSQQGNRNGAPISRPSNALTQYNTRQPSSSRQRRSGQQSPQQTTMSILNQPLQSHTQVFFDRTTSQASTERAELVVKPFDKQMHGIDSVPTNQLPSQTLSSTSLLKQMGRSLPSEPSALNSSAHISNNSTFNGTSTKRRSVSELAGLFTRDSSPSAPSATTVTVSTKQERGSLPAPRVANRPPQPSDSPPPYGARPQRSSVAEAGLFGRTATTSPSSHVQLQLEQPVSQDTDNAIQNSDLIELANQQFQSLGALMRRVEDAGTYRKNDPLHLPKIHHGARHLLMRVFHILGMLHNQRHLREEGFQPLFIDEARIGRVPTTYELRNQLMHYSFKFNDATELLLTTIRELSPVKIEIKCLKNTGKMSSARYRPLNMQDLSIFSLLSSPNDEGQVRDKNAIIHDLKNYFELLSDFHEEGLRIQNDSLVRWEHEGDLHAAMSDLCCLIGQRLKDLNKYHPQSYELFISTIATTHSDIFENRKLFGKSETGVVFELDRTAVGHAYNEESTRPGEQPAKLFREYLFELFTPSGLLYRSGICHRIVNDSPEVFESFEQRSPGYGRGFKM